MKPTKKQKKFVIDAVSKWRPILYLHKWDFEVDFMSHDDGPASAEITPLHQYYKATITIFPKFWSSSDDKKEETIVHELLHAVTSPIVAQFQEMLEDRHVTLSCFNQFKEAVTQHLTNIIYHNKLLK